MIEFDKAPFAYELANIQLKYEVIHSKELTDETLSNHENGKRFIYEHVTHLKTISVGEGSDTIISESIIQCSKEVNERTLFLVVPFFHEY